MSLKESFNDESLALEDSRLQLDDETSYDDDGKLSRESSIVVVQSD